MKMLMNFYCANLIVSPTISKLSDPEHRNWHTRSLQILFDVMPDKPCYIDCIKGPEYVREYDIPIKCELCSPERLLEQQVRTTLKPMMWKNDIVYRYLLRTNEIKKLSTDWIAHYFEPIIIWFSDPDKPHQSPSIFDDPGQGVSYVVPTNPIFAVIYHWDSPQMEILSMQDLDISPLLSHGWKRRKLWFRSKNYLPFFSEIFDLDYEQSIYCKEIGKQSGTGNN
jgi:hypothetical protein